MTDKYEEFKEYLKKEDYSFRTYNNEHLPRMKVFYEFEAEQQEKEREKRIEKAKKELAKRHKDV